jgi:ATP-dependent Lon protease
MDIDYSEKLEELPIFPLATVLFPGAILPLHIFEDRYKEMMRTAIENEGLFGLSYRDDAEVGHESLPDIGSVGCIAKINAVMPLDEGRMNVISTGLIRYKVLELRQVVPFLVARVEAFGDDPDPDPDVDLLFERTAEICKQFITAAQALNELSTPVSTDLPEDAESFSLLASSLLPFDNKAKQHLLEMTSTRGRLMRVRRYMTAALTEYSDRLRIQERAKNNGHGRLQESESQD